jgi:hypothetical protein
MSFTQTMSTKMRVKMCALVTVAQQHLPLKNVSLIATKAAVCARSQISVLSVRFVMTQLQIVVRQQHRWLIVAR